MIHQAALDSAVTHDPQLTGVRGGENSAGSCKNYLQPKNVKRKTEPCKGNNYFMIWTSIVEFMDFNAESCVIPS